MRYTFVAVVCLCAALVAGKTIQQTAEDILSVERQILQEIRDDHQAAADHGHNWRSVLRALAGNMERNDVMTEEFRQSQQEAYVDYQKILELIRKPRLPEKYRYGYRAGASNEFSWTSCGKTSDIVQVKAMALKPDPLVFPGNVTVSGEGQLNSDMTSPIALDFKLSKKMGPAWIEVPCSLLQGCHVDDACQALEKYSPCPFKAGPVSLKDTTIPISEQVPSGDYKFHIEATSKGKAAFCLDITFSIG